MFQLFRIPSGENCGRSSSRIPLPEIKGWNWLRLWLKHSLVLLLAVTLGWTSGEARDAAPEEPPPQVDEKTRQQLIRKAQIEKKASQVLEASEHAEAQDIESDSDGQTPTEIEQPIDSSQSVDDLEQEDLAISEATDDLDVIEEAPTDASNQAPLEEVGGEETSLDEETPLDQTESLKAQNSSSPLELPKTTSGYNTESDPNRDYFLPTYTGPREIHHPWAKQGLFKVTREKIYLFKTPVSKQNRSSSFKVGSYTLDNLSDPEQRVFFDEIYTNSDPIVLFYDYVWQRKWALGKWGWKLGTGIFVGTGQGRFKSNGREAREKFTFIMAPNTAAICGQLRFWDKQPIVPFGEAGLDLFTALELRDDNKGPKAGAGLGAHVAGGLAFNLGVLDRNSVINLDREYGINDIYIVVEFRQIIKLSSIDFSGTAITGGFMAEF